MEAEEGALSRGRRRARNFGQRAQFDGVGS